MRAPHGLPLGEEIREDPGKIWESVRCWGLRGAIPRLLSPRQEDSRNYLTLVEQYGDGLLVCGTGACAPTCWNVVRILPSAGQGKPGLPLPAGPDPTQDPFVPFPRRRGRRARPGMGEGSLPSPPTPTRSSSLMVSRIFSPFSRFPVVLLCTETPWDKQGAPEAAPRALSPALGGLSAPCSVPMEGHIPLGQRVEIPTRGTGGTLGTRNVSGWEGPRKERPAGIPLLQACRGDRILPKNLPLPPFKGWGSPARTEVPVPHPLSL